MRPPKLRAATAVLALALGLALAACGDDSSEAGGAGGSGGTGIGGSLGGSGGDDGDGGGLGGEGGNDEGGSGGPACNLLDLEGSGEACQSCVGNALVGACQESTMGCLQANPNAVICGTQAGCTRIGQSPPIDLACLASACGVELLQLNTCLMQCEAYTGCFL